MTPANKLSTNQITEVGILKPSCADFCGNSLNDWLKWLAEEECEGNYKNLNLECIKSKINLSGCDCQSKRDVFDIISKGMCWLVDQVDTLSNSSLEEETIYPLAAIAPWTSSLSVSPIKALKKGKRIILQGKITEGTATQTSLIQLPAALVPSQTQRFIVFHEFAQGTYVPSQNPDYLLGVQINTAGLMSIVIVGNIPSGSGSIYLDGITYFQTT